MAKLLVQNTGSIGHIMLNSNIDHIMYCLR